VERKEGGEMRVEIY
jgi:hypothetical protein